MLFKSKKLNIKNKHNKLKCYNTIYIKFKTKNILINKKNFKNFNKNKVIRFRKKKKLNVIFINTVVLKQTFLVSNIYFNVLKKKFFLKLHSSTLNKVITNNFNNVKLFSYITFYYFFLKKFNCKFITQLFFIENFKKITNIGIQVNLIKNSVIYSKALGSYSILLNKDFKLKYLTVRLPSKEVKRISINSYATFDKNFEKLDLKFKYFYKNNLYVKRKLGFKSKVRGVAMNPVDHPHGGNTKSIKFPRTPWGKATKKK